MRISDWSSDVCSSDLGAGMDIFRTDVLAGKSILVTGGGSGLGLEISKALAAKGAAVHICVRRANVLEAAAPELEVGNPGKVHCHTCAIHDADQVHSRVGARWKVGAGPGLCNTAPANILPPNK